MEITLNLDEKEIEHLTVIGCADELKICRVVCQVLAQIKEKIKEKNKEKDDGTGAIREIDGSPSSPSI